MALPNDSIAVTPGAGAIVATHSIGGKEYQVFIPAGPSGHLTDSLESWFACADAVAFANNKHMFSLLNGAGSGKLIKVHKLFALNLQIAAVTGVGFRFDVKRITAHAAGSAVTPQPFDTNNAALPAQITCYTNSASVSEGALLFPFVYNNDEVGATAAAGVGSVYLQGLNLLMESPRMQELILREGQGVTVKNVTNTTVGSYAILCGFTVE